MHKMQYRVASQQIPGMPDMLDQRKKQQKEEEKKRKTEQERRMDQHRRTVRRAEMKEERYSIYDETGAKLAEGMTLEMVMCFIRGFRMTFFHEELNLRIVEEEPEFTKYKIASDDETDEFLRNVKEPR